MQSSNNYIEYIFNLYRRIYAEINDVAVKSPYLVEYFECFFLEVVMASANERITDRKSTGRKIIDIVLFVRNFLYFLYANSAYAKEAHYFFPTDETHLRQMIPVAMHIKQGGGNVFFITNKVRFIPVFKKNSFSFKIWILPPVIFKSNYLLRDLRSANIDSAAKNALFDRFLSFKQLRTYYRKLFFYKKPLSVIVGNDLIPFCRTGVVLAKLNKIPTYCIQHGSMNRLNPFYQNIIVDKYFVFGETVKLELEHIGLESNKIIVSGSPYLSELKFSDTSTTVIVNDLKMSHLPKILILFSGPGHSTSMKHHSQLLESIYSLANGYHGRYDFILKIHPKDKICNYQDTPSNVFVFDNSILHGLGYQVFDLMRISEFIISGVSTAVIEALYLGKKVFTIDYNNEYSEADFIAEGATIHCQNHEELLLEFERYIQNADTLLKKRRDCIKNEYIRKSLYFKEDESSSVIIAKHLTGDILNS